MTATPFPEELANIRDVRAAGDIFQSLVVNRQGERSLIRLAFLIGKLEQQARSLPGQVGLGRGDHLDIEHPLYRGHEHLAGYRVNFAAVYSNGLDKKVWQVLGRDIDFDNLALACELY